MKSAAQPAWRGPLSLGMILLAALVPACGATQTTHPPLPPGLPPLMQALRRSGRDFGRALVTRNIDLMIERAPNLTGGASMLKAVGGPPEFAAHSEVLLQAAIDLDNSLAAEADPERASTIFDDFISTCIACHQRFRAE